MKPIESKNTREQPNDDNYLSRIVAISNIGTQPAFMYQGEMTKPDPRWEITYELVTTNMNDGRPFWVSEEVPSKIGSKKLASRYMAANVAEGSDAKDLLNKPVMVATKKDAKGYAKVTSVAGVPSGLPVPELRNPTHLFDMFDENLDLDLYNSFSDFKKSKFTRADDFEKSSLYKALSESATDDIPF